MKKHVAEKFERALTARELTPAVQLRSLCDHHWIAAKLARATGVYIPRDDEVFVLLLSHES